MVSCGLGLEKIVPKVIYKNEEFVQKIVYIFTSVIQSYENQIPVHFEYWFFADVFSTWLDNWN